MPWSDFDARWGGLAPFRGGLGQLDAEYAAVAGHVADVDDAALRLDRLARDRQPEAEAAAVLAALDQRRKQVVNLAGREPAARIRDLDRHAARFRVRRQI